MTLGMVGIEGIADILGVTEGRVRQLILEEGFPRPMVALSPRNRVWSTSSIRAYKRSREEITTLAFASLPPASAPLPRIFDGVITAHQNLYIPSAHIYVRAWQGDGFTIALLAALEPMKGLSGQIEGYVTSLVRQLPVVLGGDVCWLLESKITSAGSTTNVVLAQPVPGEFANPTWANVQYDALAAVVGERVEMYPDRTLTEENLRRFKNSRAPIELSANENEIAAHIDELEELQRSPLTSAQREYAQDLVAQMLRWHDEAGKRGETPDPEWRNEDAQVRWAVRRRYRSLTDSERARAAQHFTNDPIDEDLASATIENLALWITQVDEYSSNPRPRTARVARSLANGIWSGISDPVRRERYRALLEHDLQGRVVLAPATAPAAERYFAGRQLHPIRLEHRQREHRILAAALYEDEERQVIFGHDLFGNHIARSSSDMMIAILWPGFERPATPADQLRLDGDTNTIATVLVNGAPSHLLPRIQHPASWAIGYDGGSSGDLVAAIIRYLDASGLTPDDEAVRSFVYSSDLPETRTIHISELLGHR